MPDTDATTTTDTTPAEVERDHRMLYATDRLTLPMAFAAIHGQQNGLLTFESLPWEMSDGPAFLAAVREVLTETGALASYQRSVAIIARPAECPWWCAGKHPSIFEGCDSLAHELPIAQLQVTRPDITGPRTIDVLISSMKLEAGNDAPIVEVLADPGDAIEGMTAETGRLLIAALTSATDTLEEIQRVTPA